MGLEAEAGHVVRVKDLPEFWVSNPKTGERFTRARALLDGFDSLVAHHEILEPGHRSSSPHRHTTKEEFVFVLSGQLGVEINGKTVALQSGDCVRFRPADDAVHTLRNDSSEPAAFLSVGTVSHDDHVLYSPSTLSEAPPV